MVEDDIVPSLLARIESEFDKNTFDSDKLKQCFKKLDEKNATYIEVHEFAIELGKILSDSLQTHINVEVLPNGKMYFNIAERILTTTMKKNYDLITSFSEDVQTLLNQKANLGLKGQIPDLNQDRINGLIERLSSDEHYDDVKWLLKEPIINFSQSIVDDAVKKNIEFHSKVGLSPVIRRRLVGKACEWCRKLEGNYSYQEVPSEVYQRHERCRCTVDYIPSDGKKQNVWSKAWK